MFAYGRLVIGISACFMHPDPNRNAFASKTLNYIEQSMARWVLSAHHALPVMIPDPGVYQSPGALDLTRQTPGVDEYAETLDGLILHGGADVWPGSYGEAPLRPEWAGDAARDRYEIALLNAFSRRCKPVLGICRGLQLMNVAFGGTLHQDITTQVPGARLHRDAGLYDGLFHPVDILPKTRLKALLAGDSSYKINSVHHQAIKDLASGFEVEARCPEDGTIEAIRHRGEDYLAAVQWHPEFHRREDNTLDDTPILKDFLSACDSRRRVL